MKLTVLQENFAIALSTASRFTSSRAQLPVLGNILLSASKNKLRVSSTNLETSVSINLGAQVKEDGEITIPAKVITEIILNLSAGPLDLESDKEHVKIISQNFSSRVLGMNSADFPKIPQTIDESKAIVLPKTQTSEALSQVIFSASQDESRPILTGVLFIFSKNGISLVATDGFRLSQKRIGFKGAGETKKVVLPKNALVEISRLGEESTEIKFLLKDSENQAVFAIGENILSSRVLEGEFPDFEKIIPKSGNIEVRADKQDLLRAVKLASVFARDSANIVNLKLGKDFIKILAESSQSGNQEMSVEARIEGEKIKDFEIAFNYKFLEEFLRVVKGEEIQMEFTGSNAPGVFTDPQDADYLHLIMPVKVQG